MSKKPKKKKSSWVVNPNVEPATATITIQVEGGKGKLPQLLPMTQTINCKNALELQLELRRFVDAVVGAYQDTVNGC